MIRSRTLRTLESAVKLDFSEPENVRLISNGEYRVTMGSAESVLDERFKKVLKDLSHKFHSHVKLIVVILSKHGEIFREKK